MTHGEAIEIINNLRNYYGIRQGGEKYAEALDFAISYLLQEPKIGHWDYIPKYRDIAWRCSECEHFTTIKYKYCPDCGAKMI